MNFNQNLLGKYILTQFDHFKWVENENEYLDKLGHLGYSKKLSFRLLKWCLPFQTILLHSQSFLNLLSAFISNVSIQNGYYPNTNFKFFYIQNGYHL